MRDIGKELAGLRSCRGLLIANGLVLLLAGCDNGTKPPQPNTLDGRVDADADAASAPAPIADGWVSYGNGPQNWFFNPAERELTPDTAQRLELKWKLDAEVTAPPAVVGDRVYVTTGQRGLYALAIEDGRELWHNPDLSSYSAPAYDETTKTLYVNRWEGGVLHAIDPENGAVLWSQPISDQGAVRGWSSPVIARGLLVVGIASSDRGMLFKGGLSVFDLAAKSRAFAYTHAEEQGAGVSVWGGPSIDVESFAAFAGSGNNYTLADGRSNALFGVALSGNEMLWNRQLEANDRWAYDCINCGPDHDFGTNPILFEHQGRKLLAAGQKSGSFWLLDRTTGEVLWEKKVSSVSHPAYGGVLNNGAFDGTRLLVAGNEGSAPGRLFALDPDPSGDGRVLWERPLQGLVIAPITVTAGLAFVPVGKTLEVIDVTTGNTIKVLAASAPVAGAASVSHGRVFFGSGVSYYDRGAEPGAFLAFGLGNAASGGTTNDADKGSGKVTFEPGSATWKAVFEEIIVGQGCNGGPLCHGGSVGNLQMNDRAATYAALVGVKAMGTNTADAKNPNCADTGLMRVAPGAPDQSLLIQKLEPRADGSVTCGAMMPPTGKLEPARIAQLRAWIAKGAHDD